MQANYCIALGYPLGFLKTSDKALYYVEKGSLFGLGQMQMYLWLKARFGISYAQLLPASLTPEEQQNCFNVMNEMAQQGLLLFCDSENTDSLVQALFPLRGLRQGEGRGGMEGEFSLQLGTQEKTISPQAFALWLRCNGQLSINEAWWQLAAEDAAFNNSNLIANCILALLRDNLLYLC